MVGEERVSVVVPNRDNAARLRACLAGVFADLQEEDGVEVIVVDNGSADDSVRVAREFPVKVLHENRILTPFAARNTGIEAARGEVIVLLDSNCVPLKGWFAAGMRSLRAGSDIVGGPLRFEAIQERDWIARFDRMYATIYPEDIEARTSLPSGQLFIRRKVFETVGTFLPHARGLGDIEWTGRAIRAGFRLGWAEAAKVRYPAKSGWAFCKKMYRLGRGKKELRLYRHHTLYSPAWMLQLAKMLLPPSPVFFRRMHIINQKEGLNVPWPAIIVLCWWTKLLRGAGMLFGKCNSDHLSADSK